MAAEHLSLLIDEKTEGYCRSCYEAYVIWAAAAVLEEKMKESGTEELFRTIEMPLLFTLFAMEQAGVRVEAEALRFYGEQLGTKIVELEKEIYAQAGEAFNNQFAKAAWRDFIRETETATWEEDEDRLFNGSRCP